jgi:hypothetical protein
VYLKDLVHRLERAQLRHVIHEIKLNGDFELTNRKRKAVSDQDVLHALLKERSPPGPLDDLGALSSDWTSGV